MEKLPVSKSTRPGMMPWQAALMIVCVTAAGVLHEHSGAMRPMVNSLATAQSRSDAAPGSHPVEALNAVVWHSR